MSQPLKQIPRTSTVAWCASEAAPTLMAMGSSASSVDLSSEAALDFVSYDPSRTGTDMDVQASISTGGRRFTSLSWGALGIDTGVYPYGILAGGLQDGIVNLWNPNEILTSKGASQGLLHSSQVHQGQVNCVEFHPAKPNLLATCGSDSQVNILNIDNPSKPEVYKPGEVSKHAGSEVLCCAWNRKVPHILCSSSNTGTTVVWDLKLKKEVISFQDPANRQRCSGVAWHPAVPTQLLVSYDDDRNPSMQMWDLRNCQYPFKETAGHSKGILGIAWNPMDPNLLLSCGRDNRTICWCLSTGTPEIFSEINSSQCVNEVKWAPHKPSIISAASSTGSVGIHAVHQQQTSGAKYCPKWYGSKCGTSFGFGGKMLAFGRTPQADGKDVAKSWCHSLIMPNEPELVPAADQFEHWIAERKLREYCSERVEQQRRQGASQHDVLMWDLMSLAFEGDGRKKVPEKLGFEADRITSEAEKFLGQKPGMMLMGPSEAKEDQTEAERKNSETPHLGPELDLMQAESFFEDLCAQTENKAQEARDKELIEQQKAQEALAKPVVTAIEEKADWSKGPESLIKQSLLVGDLTAAVECCMKSGRMSEALLLASGGGTPLWTRTRDEYLRLQADPFLKNIGHILTNDFEKLVANSDLSTWMETLAILATYAGEQYAPLCEQLGTRLETEKFDIRSAVICYICANNFPKTVSIWANTHLTAQGSRKLALQDLVEKMAVLQEATKFNQTDSLFNAKLTHYAEILANSGRLTAAMRYLCLLRDDASSAILRDRIYNSAPQQMAAQFGRAPAFPFDSSDIRIVYQPPAAAQPQYAAAAPNAQYGGAAMGKAPAPGHPGARPGTTPGHPSPHMAGAPAPYPGMPMTAGPGVRPPAAPGYGGGAPGPNPGMPGHPGMPAANPGMPPAPKAPSNYNNSMPPAPKVGAPAGPPNMGGPPAPAYNNMPGGGMPPAPSMQQRPGMANNMGPGGMAPGHGYGGPGGMPPGAGAAPSMGPGVMPPGHMHQQHHAPAPAPPPAASYGAPPPRQGVCTAPQASAVPVVEGLPVAWPLPTGTQQKLSTTSSVAEQNQRAQALSVDGAHTGQGAASIGEPMQAHDLQTVQTCFAMMLQAVAAKDGNARKRDDIAKRLDDLYAKLHSGSIKTATSQKVVAMVQAINGQDLATAGKIQVELSASDWDQNKNWLMGIKRLLA